MVLPKSVWGAVFAALLVRLSVMAFVYPERLDPSRDYWHYAGETGRVARSLVLGQGFSSPLFAPTGPTAWLGPIFPSLLAGVFKVFGIYTKASLLTILSIDCLLSALTCVPIYILARNCFGEHAGRWSSRAWAIFPYSIFFAADFVWATTLSTLLLTTLFVMALSLPRSTGKTDWALFGLLYGFAGLNDPIVLGVLPVMLLWACYQRWRQGSKWFLRAAIASLTVLLTVAPWCIRNYRTFHKFIPIRGGIGLELYCGNNADSWHWNPPGYHPSDTESDWREYQQNGEIAFMDHKQAQALAFIRTHRALYVKQTLRRVVYIWTGYWSFDRRYLAEEPMDPYNIVFCTGFTLLVLAGLRKGLRQAPAASALLAITCAAFPLVYYLTHPDDYYRRPIDPLLVVLAVAAFTSTAQQVAGSTEGRTVSVSRL